MRAVALSFAGPVLSSPQVFLDYVYDRVTPAAEGEQLVLVFPAHLALLYALHCGELGKSSDFRQASARFLEISPSWPAKYLNLQRAIARRLKAYVVPGSMLVAGKRKVFHEACLISPAGEVLGRQQQLFLSREERELGWSRGAEVKQFTVGADRLAISIGTHAWYPEVGRVMALQGTDIICHCGAIAAGENNWRQIAGMWLQVQQNQFFCIESQLTASIAGRAYRAPCLIHAPCEMTPGNEGILAKGGLRGEAVMADMQREIRREIIKAYPLLELLNPAAYQGLCFYTGGEQ